MKTLFLLFFIAASVHALPLKVHIFGIESSPDVKDVKNLQALIGTLMTEGRLQKFEILSYGIEGGFEACVERSPQDRPATVLSSLQALKVNEKKTDYGVKEVQSCLNKSSK